MHGALPSYDIRKNPQLIAFLLNHDDSVVIPGLTEALKRSGWNPPIVFAEQTGEQASPIAEPVSRLIAKIPLTDLIRENQFNIEKNWAPFLGEKDEVSRHVHSRVLTIAVAEA